MGTTKKIVLILVGCAVVAAAAAGVAAYVYKSDFADLKAEGNAVKEEARKFGSANDDVACLDASFDRSDACRKEGGFDFKCRALAATFLKSCLSRARVTTALCTGVPVEASTVDAAAWGLAACAQKGRSPTKECGRIMQLIHDECAWRAKK